MALRFRKRLKLFRGVHFNINKDSVGLSVGGKGIGYTINTKGRKTGHVGIPGTGLSYVKTSNNSKKGDSSIKKDLVCSNCEKNISYLFNYCPYCGIDLSSLKKINNNEEIVKETSNINKSGLGCIIVFVIFFALLLFVPTFAYFLSKVNYLVIVDAKGNIYETGVMEYDGVLQNNYSYRLDNINITITCYKNSDEQIGQASALIPYIESRNSVHFHAVGTGIYGDNSDAKCYYDYTYNKVEYPK